MGNRPMPEVERFLNLRGTQEVGLTTVRCGYKADRSSALQYPTAVGEKDLEGQQRPGEHLVSITQSSVDSSR